MILVECSDRFGTGMLRLGWPAQYLQEAGHDDIKLDWPDTRWGIGAKLRQSDQTVVGAFVPPGTTTIVIQRATHKHLVDSIPFFQEQGVRCVVDIDDALDWVHPSNPAYTGLRPGNPSLHSWLNLRRACQMADAVTVTTPALATMYRPDAVILPNLMPDHFYGRERIDSTEICWPASLPSHPNDAEEVTGVLDRVTRDTGAKVRLIGEGEHAEPLLTRAFGLSTPPILQEFVSMEDWPRFLASLGVGIAPLAGTKFNAAKSWLKPLELMTAGVPWVGSDRVEYRRLFEETGVGTVVRKQSDWYRALKRLVTDDQFRADQSAAGVEAAESYRLRDRAHLWLEVWRG